jgi:hypothetical protein
MTANARPVFLVDVDNTLLDNDAVLEDLHQHVLAEFGRLAWDYYWQVLLDLVDELGYRDYLGALQRCRIAYPHNPRLLEMSFYLLDYPFMDRLYPNALSVLERLRGWGQTVIMSDGDVVFQPRKVQRSGIWQAVGGRVLIYIHKEQELDDVKQRHPAEHYVLIDDKPRILTAVKRSWGPLVTTVFPRQGQYAREPAALAAGPPADVTIERIEDLLTYHLDDLLVARGTAAQERRKQE